ncbi:MAG: helix-turn-helix transcriptional regulator [Solirubrobacterales bacterium]|nr:helix-turn-helix transcriptional regulator [Solirubrobacterales bacterium]
MSTASLDGPLARTVRGARMARGLSTAQLAGRSGVSRAMISRIERAEAQPTAALLGRLSGALGMTLSELIAEAEGDGRRLVRAREQSVWTDPETGYARRAVSPPGAFVQLVDVRLPPGARVAFPAEAYTFLEQLIWVLRGRLHFHHGEDEHELAPGDCLQLGPPAPCTYHNRTARPCRYLVAVSRRAG